MRNARTPNRAAIVASLALAGLAGSPSHAQGPPAEGQAKDAAYLPSYYKVLYRQAQAPAEGPKAETQKQAATGFAINPYTGNVPTTEIKQAAPAPAAPGTSHPLVTIHDVPAGDPHQAVVSRLRLEVNQSCVQCHAGGVSVRKDDTLGLEVVPADETLRAQLDLKDRGLVVTSIARGSDGEAGGIKEKDILLTCDGKALASVDDLKAGVRGKTPEPGPNPRPALRGTWIALGIVRAGEPTEVRVAPPFPPTVVVGPVAGAAGATKSPGYWIGVSIDPADDTLRSHLKLAEGTGLVVTSVIAGAPAEKVGLKKNDVLVSIDGSPIKAPEDLIHAVQESKGEKGLKIGYRRARAEGVALVTPEARKEEAAAASGAMPPRGSIDVRKLRWVDDIAPFLVNRDLPLRNWAVPYTQDGTIQLWTVDGQNLAWLPQGPVAPTDLNVDLRWQRQAAEAAAKGPAVDRVDVRLKALEGQLKEIKSSMDEIKDALKAKGR